MLTESQHRLPPYKRFIDFCNTYCEVIKLGTLLIAGGFVLIQYLEHKQDAREVRALEYIYRAHAGELLNARISTEITPIQPPMSDVTAHLWPNGYECVDNELLALCPPSEEARAAQAQYVKNTQNAELRFHAHRIGAFYGALSYCALSGECDQELLCNVFVGEANNFILRFYGYMEEIEEQWAIPRGFYIERFVQMCEENGFRIKSL